MPPHGTRSSQLGDPWSSPVEQQLSPRVAIIRRCRVARAAKQVVPSIRRIAEACRPADDSARVVDVGCGTGALVDFLKDAGVDEGRVIGVDLSAEVRVEVTGWAGGLPGSRDSWESP